MDAPDDRFFAELRACTAELARIIEGDLVAREPGAGTGFSRGYGARRGRGMPRQC